MAMNAKMMSKLKNKMPPAGPKGAGDAADPIFSIPDDDDQEDGGDVDNSSENASPDAHEDDKTIARAKDGSLSEEGPEEEGTPDHEEREGKAEKASESKELSHLSSDDLLHELKRRGHPAGEHLDASAGVDREGEKTEEMDG